MEIPVLVVCLLGVGASLKYIYRVFFHKMYKNMGSMVAIVYLTLLYITLLFPTSNFHGGPFVRVGIALLFLDKILVFIYELYMSRIAACVKTIVNGGGGEPIGK